MRAISAQVQFFPSGKPGRRLDQLPSTQEPLRAPNLIIQYMRTIEKEMLAIIRALKKWRTDLIGVPFVIYTNHKTLENFDIQWDLSCRQAHWMEFLSQYNGKIVYVKGEENTVANALSRLPATYSSDLSDADSIAQAPYDTTTDSILHNKSCEPLKMVATLA